MSIFQPYFTTKRQGTGLGLFVSRKLVEEHGGTLTFESRVGRGTTFRIELPVEPLDLRPGRGGPEPVELPSAPTLPAAPQPMVNEIPAAKGVQRAES